MAIRQLEISLFDVYREVAPGKYEPLTAESVSSVVRRRLRQAGFDMHLPITTQRSIERLSTTYTQEYDAPPGPVRQQSQQQESPHEHWSIPTPRPRQYVRRANPSATGHHRE